MSVQAILNMSLNLSGGTSGPEQIVVPPLVANNALDVRINYQLAAGWTSLTAIFGTGVSYPMATGLLIFAGTGTTTSVVSWGNYAPAAAASFTPVGSLPFPICLSGGVSFANVGVCLSAGTTATLILY